MLLLTTSHKVSQLLRQSGIACLRSFFEQDKSGDDCRCFYLEIQRMFRKKDKQNSVVRAKSDPFAFVSPKKEEIQFQAKMERIVFKKVPQRMPKAQTPTCSALAFNSPRKKYAPEHQTTQNINPSAVKVDKSQREDTNTHHPKLKKILLEERANLRKQQRFLYLQQQKIDHENACLREQIKQLQKTMREPSQSSTLTNPLAKYMQRHNCLLEAGASDTFLVA